MLLDRPQHKQYRRYWKVIEEFMIEKGWYISQKNKIIVHIALKDYFNVESIAKNKILRIRLTKYINQVEMFLSREYGFVLGDNELKL
jgi:D-hexose-6-phosphate mutarotase